MKIELSKTLASNGAVANFDVRQMKKALNRLGYYTPYEKVGITGIPDMRMFDALKSFQRMSNLRASGEARARRERACG